MWTLDSDVHERWTTGILERHTIWSAFGTEFKLCVYSPEGRHPWEANRRWLSMSRCVHFSGMAFDTLLQQFMTLNHASSPAAPAPHADQPPSQPAAPAPHADQLHSQPPSPMPDLSSGLPVFPIAIPPTAQLPAITPPPANTGHGMYSLRSYFHPKIEELLLLAVGCHTLRTLETSSDTN